MIKQYFKQALQMLRENALTSVVSILGTALSVAMILIVVLQFQIKQAAYRPESNRDRMLYIVGILANAKEGPEKNNTSLSSEVAKECLYRLQKPEVTSVIAKNNLTVSLPEKRLFEEYWVGYTDPGFWKIFDFQFVAGHPFSESDFNSGLPRAVITDYLARKLFRTLDIIGRDVQIDNVLYTITGVVKRSSTAARDSYADVWVPYTSNSIYTDNKRCEGIAGDFIGFILARQKADFNVIKAELQQEVTRYNTGKSEFVMIMPEPFTSLDRALGSSSMNNYKKLGWRDYLSSTGILLLFLLLVPTLNLTGVVQASVQKRRSEMGLRKAFGATKNRLMIQILSENLVVTFIGGLLGILLSVVLLHLCKSFLLTEATVITFEMLFKPGLFVAALFFTLLLNLLSAGLPAFRISHAQIVDALKEEDK